MPSFSRKKTYSLQHERAGPRSISTRNRLKAMKGGLSMTRDSKDLKPTAGRRRRRYPNHRQPLISTDRMILHELGATLPEMPSEFELNRMFAQMVEELGLPHELMRSLPMEKKWQLYLSKEKDPHTKLEVEHAQPQFYVEQLLGLNQVVLSSKCTTEEADFELNLKAAKDLKTALRTQPLSFVLHFIELNGLEFLLEFLRRMNNKVRHSQLHFVIIGCIKALMNNSEGRAHVLAHPTGIAIITQSLRTNNIKTKVLTLEILGALCLIPGGHKKVLSGIVHFQHFACERIRFQTLMMDLGRTLDEDEDMSSLQVAIFSFLNALINYKAGEESLEFRLHLRHEFLMLGIQPIVNRLRSLNITHLNKHLDIFEFVQIEDEREFATRLHTMEMVEYGNVLKMSDILQRKTAYSTAYTHLISLLYHCLLLPVDDPHYEKYWRLIDRMVQQVAVQQDHGVDPDVSPLPINVQKLVHHLLREDEQRALVRQMEEMRRGQEHMALRLKRVEWDLEARTMERDAYHGSVDKYRAQLELQSQELTIASKKGMEMEGLVMRLTTQSEELRARCQQLEGRLKEKNVDISDLPPPVVPTVLPPTPPPPVPAPPPLLHGAVPPPPPPSGGLTTSGFLTLRRNKKNLPRPVNPTKALNWDKLHNVKNTVFENVDEMKIYQDLNLEDLEQTFHQKPSRELVATTTLPRREKFRDLTLINKKRAQNCTILLSRLKISDKEIRQVVMTMDEDDSVSKDMVEQLLKFVPTVEEIDTLREHATKIEQFSRADRFMMEMSHIPRYAQRLKSLFFKKTFEDRIGEVRPSVEDIMASCHELMMSTKLRRLLEVVLAVGNFMNKGARGDAFGFKLASLNKMVDTKSSTDRSMTLLHYIIQTLETKFPEVLTLEVDLPHVKRASKVDFAELEKEFRAIKTELQELKDELDFHRKKPSGETDDKFVSSVEDFALHAAIRVRETERLIKEMKEQFQKALTFFGEESAGATTDRFLGTFDTFLKSFADAHVQLITIRRKREDDEKRRLNEEQRKTETLRKRKARLSSLVPDSSSSPAVEGDLDELIVRLRSGDVWRDFGQTKRRSRAQLPRVVSGPELDSNRERVSMDLTPVVDGSPQQSYPLTSLDSSSPAHH